MPVTVQDLEEVFDATVLGAEHGENHSMAGDAQRVCRFHAAALVDDATEEYVVEVTVIANGQKTWKQLLGVITPHQTLPIGDEAITAKDSVYVAVRRGNKVLTIVFGEGGGSRMAVSQEQARTLAELAVKRL